MDFPVRKTLPHEVPGWVPVGSEYFITICTQARRENMLCNPEVAGAIRDGFSEYQKIGKWYVHLLLLMPDHLHAIVSFSRDSSIRKSISAWKQYLARQVGIKWQRDFFEHRLRPIDGFSEKAGYIRQNPVRAGLAESAEKWPYCWGPECFRQGGADTSPLKKTDG